MKAQVLILFGIVARVTAMPPWKESMIAPPYWSRSPGWCCRRRAVWYRL